MENQTANALTAEVLEAALNTNKIDQKIAEELGKDGEKSTMLAAHLGTALTNFDAGFAARIGAPGISPQQQKSLEKQYTSAQQTFFAQNGTFHGSTVPQAGDSAAVQAAKIQQQNKVFEKGDATTLRNIQAQDYQTYMPQIVTNMPIGKTVSVGKILPSPGIKGRGH